MVLQAQLIIDGVAHLFSVSEGAQDIDPVAVRNESFEVINGSNAQGVRAKIQTYCRVKITDLKLQRNKDFQFIVKSDSQGGQQKEALSKLPMWKQHFMPHHHFTFIRL